MNRRLTVALAAAATLGVPLVGVTAAGAAPRKNEIRIVGGPTMVPGKYVKDTVRFAPANLTVKSGATVTLRNKAKVAEEPHTISFIKKRFLPRSLDDQRVFPPLGAAHQFDEATGNVGVPIVDDGAAGGAQLNVNTLGDDKKAGDSQYIAPGTKKITFKVTARKGAKLYYFCAIHPWMQGRIAVR